MESPGILCLTLLLTLALPGIAQQSPDAASQLNRFAPVAPIKSAGSPSSAYIPLDSWMYPAVMRLYSLGFVDTVFLGLRPWTRLSVARMLEESANKITDSSDQDANQDAKNDASDLYTALEQELARNHEFGHTTIDAVYERVMGIAGTPLRDSFHLGQTDVNDFGRPYSGGFNNFTGLSAQANYGIFSLNLRGEWQHAPAWAGYPLNLAEALATIDDFATFTSVPLAGNTTIPLGPVASINHLTVLEGYVSAHIVGHEVSLGKMDNWYGPGVGGGMAWSNNAENVWSFRINRVEPLSIPYISRIAGLIRYDFFVGPLKGHNAPVSPWTHAEKITFKPTPNVELGFERTVIWGGKGHEPVTLGTFWRSFYSISDTNRGEKFSRKDPGARFSAFDFSWRLPAVRNWLTLYLDSEVHDDVFPFTAPRHAAIRPGLYLSHMPRIPKLDLRAEVASTDPNTGLSNYGQDMYIEVVQRNGYTNNGQLMGDWIGRENKGGQAWLTYHLSPREWLQASYRSDKAARDYIPGGATQTDFAFDAVKRLTPDLELKANVQYERWLIPLYKSGRQSDTSTTVQLTWYPSADRRF